MSEQPETFHPENAPTTRRPGSKRADRRPNHGDRTGVMAETLRREHASEVREAQKRMSTVSPASPYDGEEPVDPFAPPEEIEETNEDMHVPGMFMEALPRERPRHALRSVSTTGELDPEEIVEVRSADDFPEVTLGKDPVSGIIRTFNLEAGRRYRLPRWAAEHLAEKNMIY